jgi:hypothetical protein
VLGMTDSLSSVFKIGLNAPILSLWLQKCKITNDDLCPICSIQSENIYHMLLECSSLHSFNDYIKCFFTWCSGKKLIFNIGNVAFSDSKVSSLNYTEFSNCEDIVNKIKN